MNEEEQTSRYLTAGFAELHSSLAGSFNYSIAFNSYTRLNELGMV